MQYLSVPAILKCLTGELRLSGQIGTYANLAVGEGPENLALELMLDRAFLKDKSNANPGAFGRSATLFADVISIAGTCDKD